MRPCPIGNGTVFPRIPREVAALIDALQIEGSNTDALLTLDDSEWRRLLEFSDLAHLTLSLAQVDLAGTPQWLIERLNQNLMDNAKRFDHVRAAYGEASAALSRAGVQHLVIKGFAQSPDYVSDPRLRFQSDLDLYCPPNQISAAQAALLEVGYYPVEGMDYSRADHLPCLARAGDWNWRGNPYDPAMPPSIELHFRLWNEHLSLIEISEVTRFWDRREYRSLGDLEFWCLNRIDHLAYLSLHILRGVFSGDWVVHHVQELASFLHARARDPEFWSEWRQSHSLRLRHLELIAFWLARSWFSCALSEVVRVEFDSLPKALKQWLSRFGGSPLEVMFRRNKDGRLLQLLLTRSPGSRKSALLSAIFPARIAAPNELVVGTRYRRPVATEMNRYARYAIYLGDRALVNIAANAAFLLNGLRLWLSTRTFRGQFWLFLAASFFLTWACQLTSSSSTCS